MLSPFTDRLLADAVRLHCAPPDRATVAGLTRDAATLNPRTATPSPSPPTITPSTDPSDASRPGLLGLVVARLAALVIRGRHREARHRHRLAPSWFPLYWTWKSRRGFGRPTVPADVRALIRTMSQANPLWGAPRIHGELLKVGIEVSQASVAKYIIRSRRPPSQPWRTFVTNHVQQIMAADFFVVPTATGRLLFVLVMLAHHRRRVVHVAVTAHATAGWTAQQLREALPYDDAPRYLLRDRDLAFAAVGVIVEAMGIAEVRTAPRSPWQNGHIERFIGSVRRECLDHVIILSAVTTLAGSYRAELHPTGSRTG